mmetsp:Transcript_138333/g.327635  ORF Transcript_138333/g.327635 Transcript_138333/m.327635 type:complete len:306 (-) Transcript_138333:1808-2725(-)
MGLLVFLKALRRRLTLAFHLHHLDPQLPALIGLLAPAARGQWDQQPLALEADHIGVDQMGRQHLSPLGLCAVKDRAGHRDPADAGAHIVAEARGLVRGLLRWGKAQGAQRELHKVRHVVRAELARAQAGIEPGGSVRGEERGVDSTSQELRGAARQRRPRLTRRVLLGLVLEALGAEGDVHLRQHLLLHILGLLLLDLVSLSLRRHAWSMQAELVVEPMSIILQGLHEVFAGAVLQGRDVEHRREELRAHVQQAPALRKDLEDLYCHLAPVQRHKLLRGHRYRRLGVQLVVGLAACGLLGLEAPA